MGSCQELGEFPEKWRDDQEDQSGLQGSETLLYSAIMVDICDFVFAKTHRTVQHRGTANVNYGVQLIIHLILVRQLLQIMSQQCKMLGETRCVEEEMLYANSLYFLFGCSANLTALKKQSY